MSQAQAQANQPETETDECWLCSVPFTDNEPVIELSVRPHQNHPNTEMLGRYHVSCSRSTVINTYTDEQIQERADSVK